MDYAITYLSPEGKVVLDTSTKKEVFIEADSLDGFVGQFEDTGVSTIGASGETIDLRDRKILPTEGSFTVVATSREAWARVRRAFSARTPGTLAVEASQRCILPVRLSESLPSPGTMPARGARIEVSLIRHEGAWLNQLASPGPEVSVLNNGETPLWPRIHWAGTGGQVTLPSGATFTLPEVTGEHTLHLERRRAGQVYDALGVYDRDVTKRVGAVSEMVPVGQQRTFTLPSGARLEWEVEVLDPWI